MAKYPKPKGENGDASFIDLAEQMLAWVDESERPPTHKIPPFVRACLRAGEFDAALVAARGTPESRWRVTALGWVALDEQAGEEIAAEALAAWDNVGFGEIESLSTPYHRGLIAPVVPALVALRAAQRHGLDAASLARALDERMEILVDARVDMSPVLQAMLDLDDLDAAVELHKRLSVPWEQGIKKGEDGLWFDHPPAGISSNIVARLLCEGRREDAEALVERSSIDYEGDGMISRGRTWQDMWLHIFSATPDDKVDYLRPVVERIDEKYQMAAANSILKRLYPHSGPTRFRPIQQWNDDLFDYLNPTSRMAYGDAEGFREHFDPHPDGTYIFEKYRAELFDLDAALEAAREEHERRPNYHMPFTHLAKIAHLLIDEDKIDQARDVIAFAESMRENAGWSVELRLARLEGREDDVAAMLDEKRKGIKSRGDNAISSQIETEQEYDHPEMAARTAVKYKLRDRKLPSRRVRESVTSIAAYYLPDDIAGAIRTLDRVLGTADAKVDLTVVALQEVVG